MIRFDTVDNIRRITLDRPDKRNALTPDMLADLNVQAADEYGEWRCMLIEGAGEAFCAGFDLTMCQSDGPEQGTMRKFLQLLYDVIGSMRAQRRPVVVCAHGAAIGGGCALLAGADVVVTDAEAKLGYPVAKYGISPAISAPYLRLDAGNGNARMLMLDMGLRSGTEAHRLSLVDEIAPTPDDARALAATIAAELASKPAEAIAETKTWIRRIAPARLHKEALETSMGLITGEEALSRLESLWK